MPFLAMFIDGTMSAPQWLPIVLLAAILLVVLVIAPHYLRRGTSTLMVVMESPGATMLHNLRGVVEFYDDGTESRMRIMPDSYVNEFIANLVKIGHRPGDPTPTEEAALLVSVEVFALALDESFSWSTKGLRDPTQLMHWACIHAVVVEYPQECPTCGESPNKAPAAEAAEAAAEKPASEAGPDVQET